MSLGEGVLLEPGGVVGVDGGALGVGVAGWGWMAGSACGVLGGLLQAESARAMPSPASRWMRFFIGNSFFRVIRRDLKSGMLVSCRKTGTSIRMRFACISRACFLSVTGGVS